MKRVHSTRIAPPFGDDRVYACEDVPLWVPREAFCDTLLGEDQRASTQNRLVVLDSRCGSADNRSMPDTWWLRAAARHLERPSGQGLGGRTRRAERDRCSRSR